jgi:hypothetical protein
VGGENDGGRRSSVGGEGKGGWGKIESDWINIENGVVKTVHRRVLRTVIKVSHTVLESTTEERELAQYP